MGPLAVGRGRLERIYHRVVQARPRGEQGSELIEVALVLPVYFMLVFGLTSFAIVLFAYCNATFAAKAAVRYAVLHGPATTAPYTQTVIQSIVTPFLWGGPSCSGCVVITASPATPPATLGSSVTVTVNMTYTTGLPYVNLTGLAVVATGQGVMVH